ncbi:YceI family protein [Gramella jeungdoensis]|uniref:YceI family protein n=1 Tax=Gramella jeungdoensis TaxID=708091 RepID=A0ABT0Z091_9FLAO|nr:YceI family protein [Gramella jeungdoensis]MCM8568680.1 YceI family protein [Gramella jeungdoensis]
MRSILFHIILFFLVCASWQPVQAQFYQTTSASVRFYSSAPVEDIEAISKEGVSVINSDNGDISFKVKMRSFRFEKALMQEHFNENYMESEKFPDASFKGKSVGQIDISSTKPQKVIFKGKFTVHGVSKQRELPVTIKMGSDGETMSLSSEFKVKCVDHDIKIPKILWENIAEVIDVYVKAEFKIISQ